MSRIVEKKHFGKLIFMPSVRRGAESSLKRENVGLFAGASDFKQHSPVLDCITRKPPRLSARKD